jgi:hypothetical protein
MLKKISTAVVFSMIVQASFFMSSASADDHKNVIAPVKHATAPVPQHATAPVPQHATAPVPQHALGAPGAPTHNPAMHSEMRHDIGEHHTGEYHHEEFRHEGGEFHHEGRDFHRVGEYHHFEGRDYHHWGVGERELWRAGGWRHQEYMGRYGYWWVVGGVWYFYDTPVYPYPLVVPEIMFNAPVQVQQVVPVVPTVPVREVVVQQPAPSFRPQIQVQNWYFCENPRGYSPYVSSCPSGWQTVPANGPTPPRY